MSRVGPVAGWFGARDKKIMGKNKNISLQLLEGIND